MPFRELLLGFGAAEVPHHLLGVAALQHRQVVLAPGTKVTSHMKVKVLAPCDSTTGKRRRQPRGGASSCLALTRRLASPIYGVAHDLAAESAPLGETMHRAEILEWVALADVHAQSARVDQLGEPGELAGVAACEDALGAHSPVGLARRRRRDEHPTGRDQGEKGGRLLRRRAHQVDHRVDGCRDGFGHRGGRVVDHLRGAGREHGSRLRRLRWRSRWPRLVRRAAPRTRRRPRLRRSRAPAARGAPPRAR